jgi:acyl carrier protein
MHDGDTAALLQFIHDELLSDPALEVSPTTRLLSEGLIDSLDVARLAAFIEERFDIQFDSVDIRAGAMERVTDILALARARARR